MAGSSSEDRWSPPGRLPAACNPPGIFQSGRIETPQSQSRRRGEMRVFAISLILGVLVMAGASSAVAQSPANEAMARQVAQVLKESGRLKNYRVGVKYQDGVAWLDGTVASSEQRETAEALAYQADGVVRVVNRLEIAGEPQVNAGVPDSE